jgi:hypothetical protein
MALVDVEGVFYATVLVGGTRQATAATKWASIPACSGIIPVERSSLRVSVTDNLDSTHSYRLLQGHS